jgi:hypothetical protein
MLDQRGQLLRAALGFAGCSPYAPASTSARIGHIAVGMHRKGFDWHLTQYERPRGGARDRSNTTGMEHSPRPARHGTGDGSGRRGARRSGGVGGIEES